MNITATDIAQHVKGALVGNGKVAITGAAGLAEAGEADVSFVKSTPNQVILSLFLKTKAGVVIVPEGLKLKLSTAALIEVKNPLAAFSIILGLISNEKDFRSGQIHSLAYISPKAKIGKGVTIGAFSIVEDDAVIEDHACLKGQNYVGPRSKIGKDSVLYPQVVLREDVSLGQRCILHSGCVIGADGYGFFFENGKHNKIPQIGSVLIGDDVEIGACTTIDRATTGATIIRSGTKIDNLVQVAHNVDIGEHTLLAAQVGIAGSTRLGKGVVLGGQVGVADHVNIADRTQVGGGAGVTKDTEPGSVLWGTPAQPLKNQLKEILYVRRLSELFKDLKKNKGEGH